ncbi:MAG: hypothetical protein ACQEQV_09000 [Fibrobacterota bacterium]
MKYLLPVFLVLLTCSRQNEDSPKKGAYIARVGSSILREDDMERRLSYAATPQERIDFTEEWINMELLSRKAREAGLHKDTSFIRQKRLLSRNLLAMMYLNEHIDSAYFGVDSTDVANYYNAYRSEFERPEEYISYEMLAYNNAQRAWRVRKNLTADNFSVYIRKNYADSAYKSTQPEPKSLLQKKGCAFLTDIRTGGIASPRNVNGMIHIYHVKSKYKKGSAFSLDEVKNKVASRARYRKHKAVVDSFMQELRKSSEYQFNREYFDSAVSENENP